MYCLQVNFYSHSLLDISQAEEENSQQCDGYSLSNLSLWRKTLPTSSLRPLDNTLLVRNYILDW